MAYLSNTPTHPTMSPGILHPILQHRFKVVFALNDRVLQGLTEHVRFCKVDMVNKRLRLSFESALYSVAVDTELQTLVSCANTVTIQLQYTTGNGYIAKYDTFDGLNVVECTYKADYSDPDMVNYIVEAEYTDRLVDLAPVDEEQFAELLKKRVEHLMMNKYVFETNDEKTHNTLVEDVNNILVKMGPFKWSVETDATCISTNALRCKISYQRETNSEQKEIQVGISNEPTSIDTLLSKQDGDK